MSTKITRFRNLLILALMCLISGSVWGQETTVTSTFKDKNLSVNEGEPIWTASISANSFETTSPARGVQFGSAKGKITLKSSTVTSPITKISIIGSTNGTAKANTISIKVGTTNFYVENTQETILPLPKENDAIWTFVAPTSDAITGDIEIEVQDNNKSVYFKSISITSINSSPGKETATIAFEESKYNLNINDATTITATTNSDATIVYSSSNQDIAEVEQDGTVYAYTAGTVTITASVAETENFTAASTSYELKIIDPNIPTPDGTFANPYSIADVIALNNTEAGPHFIKGYIIGFYGSDSKPVIGITDKVVDTNLALADNPTETDTKKIIPLQLEKNNLRTILNVKDNPKNIDKEIIIQGKLEKYFNLTGVKTPSIACIESQIITKDEINVTTTTVDLREYAIPAGIELPVCENPNCLYYVSENSVVSGPNIIKIAADNTATAENIMLEDNYNFNNIMPFTATAITYSRTFASGWNTFALPFNTAIPNGVQVEAFDKKDGNQILFTEATSIEANTAYLINVQAGGEISFAANNVTVPVTATTGDTYKSNFLHMTGDDIAGKYILVMEEGVEVFARANAEAQMHAFRGYLDLPAASGVQYSISHDGGATGINNTDIEGIKIYSINGTLIINADKTQSVQIYGLDGRMVKNIQVSEGENTVTGLAKGIYLINNQKAIIK